MRAAGGPTDGSTDDAPAVIGPYRVTGVLSRARSHIYEVQAPDGARRALKLYVAERGGTASHARNEARALSEVDSPHVARPLDTGTHDGVPYLVTDLVVGTDVLDFVDLAPITPRTGAPPQTMSLVQQQELGAPARLSRIVHAMSQAARGVAALHARDIIHRDLSPDHVLVRDADEWVTLIDLSLVARAPYRPDLGGQVIGTFKYMAPEQALGQALDTRADLYNFGVILYELLAGRHPFHSENAVGFAYHHARKAPPPLAGFTPHAPAPLVELTHALLHKDPAQRPARIEDVLAVFQRTDPHAARDAPVAHRATLGSPDVLLLDDVPALPPARRS